MNNIYLVGFMGTGKSVVARELAKAKRFIYLDLDSLIEEREKRKITEIFAEEGEAYFRKVEKGALAEISLKDNHIVSCGGGIVLDKQNIEIMKKTGAVVCLTADPDVIIKRTKNNKDRPLLNVPNPREKIEFLLKSRAPFYAQADFTVDTSYIAIEEVVRKIESLLPLKK